MAIGNVGTYATVEGAPVDFAKLISSNVKDYQDRQDEQEKARQAQEAAKAKSTSEEVKNLKDIKNYVPSGKYEYDNPALSAVAQYKDGLYELQQKVSRGEISSLYANQYADKASQAVDVMSSGAKYIQDKANEFAKTAKDRNSKFMDENALSNILKDIKPEVDAQGNMVYHYKDKDGELATSNINEIVDRVYDVPYNVNTTAKLKAFQDTHKQDEVARVSGGMIKTPTEKSKFLLESISSEAGAWISDRDTKATLWSQYEETLPEKDRVGQKKDNFSSDQNQKLYDFTKNIIENSYPKELKMTSLPKAGGGSGSGGSSIKQSTTSLDASTLPSGRNAVGKGYQLKKPIVYNEMSVKGKPITGFNVTKFNYDKQGNIVLHGYYQTVKSSRMNSSEKDAFAELTTIINGGTANDDQQEEYSKLLETYGSVNKQLSVIGNGEQFESPIANSLGFSSVDDFRARYKKGATSGSTTTNKSVSSSSSNNKVKNTAPRTGTVVNGYTFTGGNPNDKNNWKQNK